ncbi:MAG TPA: pitrilysin family protein [Vicinamibacterales bacterium]|nr:pitrilysin family protein [Vicinamibacterales bacterium]
MIALGLRIWMAYGAVAVATALLCASVVGTADAQSATAQAAAATRQWPSEGPPRALPARKVNFPPYDIRTLANGLQVVIVSHHEQPSVSVRMLVRAGAAHDPKGKMGLAMLTASLLDQGAGARSAEQIADSIDFVGGILGTGAGTDLTFVNTVVMKDSLDLGLQLMADVVRRPTFAADEIERQRQQAMSGLKVAAEDPDSLASRVIDRLIYGFHPYGLPGSGTAESLASLTRQDIVDYHRRFFAPNNALVAVVGDVSPAEALAGLEKAFGDWKPQDVPVFQPIDPPQPTKRVIVIDKPDAVQTEIRVGQIGIPRRHNDFLAMDQAVKILGGEGANRLQQVLRSQRGLTYGASADLETYKATGGIVAETDTRTDATAEVLRVTVDEFYKLQRERVHERELEGAQDYLAGHFPLTIETPDAIATQILNQLFYELPLEELQTYPERVRSVTPDDVQRVARNYLRPDRLAVVLVGNADGFIKDLKGVGFGDFERIPIGQVDLLAADLRRGSNRIGAAGALPSVPLALSSLLARTQYQQSPAQAAPEASANDQQQVEALLTRVLDAHGGRAALLAVKRLTADATTSLMTPDGKLSATTRTSIEYPTRVRVEATLPEATIIQIYADGKGWIRDPAGVHDAPEPMLQDLRTAALRDPIALLRSAAAGTLVARLRPDEMDRGRAVKVLALFGIDTGAIRLYIDAATGELVKTAFAARPTPQGASQVEEVFADYRRVEGIRVPFKASIMRGGTAMLERTLTTVTLNPTFAADTFGKPAR